MNEAFENQRALRFAHRIASDRETSQADALRPNAGHSTGNLRIPEAAIPLDSEQASLIWLKAALANLLDPSAA